MGEQLWLGSHYLREGQFDDQQGGLRSLLKAVHLTGSFVTAASRYMPKTPECLQVGFNV